MSKPTKSPPRSVVVDHLEGSYTIRTGHKSRTVPASRRAAPHVAAILRLRGVTVIEVTSSVFEQLDADIAGLKADLAEFAKERLQTPPPPPSHPADGALSLPVVARMLGVTYSRLSYGIEHGHIQSTLGLVCGRPARLIPSAEIARLAAQFARAS